MSRHSRITHTAAIAATGAGLWLAAATGVGQVPADRIFVGDHIVTASGASATAVAVAGDRIVWTGARQHAGAWTGAQTRIEALGERALLPGFIDAHGHLSFLAQTIDWANLSPPPVGAVDSIGTLADMLRAHIEAKRVPPGEWVIGYGYDDSLLAERRHPVREDLDGVSAAHPIVLLHVSGHLIAANSLALQRADISSDSADPEGGHIRRRGDGREPDGVLEETATVGIRTLLQAEARDPRELIEEALDVYARHGITTVQEGAATPPVIAALEAMDREDRLDLDVVAYAYIGGPGDPGPDPADVGRYGRRFKIGGVKFVLDGSPQGKTAYLSLPYAIPPAGQSAAYRGYPTFTDAVVDALVAKFLGHMQILAHANGDAAAQQLIDAVAGAERVEDHRTVMIHAQTVREDQLDRMRDLGILPSYFSAHPFYWGDWHRDSVLGPERAARISPTRSTVRRRMRFTIHNDAPVVPPDMIRLLWTTTNRSTRSHQVLGADQRLSTEEALVAMTRDAAYQYFEENQKGTLAAGKQADLVILSEDPRSIAPADLERIRVIETVSRGQTVFCGGC